MKLFIDPKEGLAFDLTQVVAFEDMAGLTKVYLLDGITFFVNLSFDEFNSLYAETVTNER